MSQKFIITCYENVFRGNLLEHKGSIKHPLITNTGNPEVDNALFQINSPYGGLLEVDYATFRSWCGKRFINDKIYEDPVFFYLTTTIGV